MSLNLGIQNTIEYLSGQPSRIIIEYNMKWRVKLLLKIELIVVDVCEIDREYVTIPGLKSPILDSWIY